MRVGVILDVSMSASPPCARAASIARRLDRVASRLLTFGLVAACSDASVGASGGTTSTSDSATPSTSQGTSPNTSPNATESTTTDDPARPSEAGGSPTTATSDASTSTTTLGSGTDDGDTTTDDSTGAPAPGSTSTGEDSPNASSADSGDGPDVYDAAFVEVAVAAGMDHVADLMAPPPGCLIDAIDPPIAGLFCSPERYSGGAAVTDLEGDGDLDVYVTRPYSADLMYVNDGTGHFVDAAVDLGLGDTLPTAAAAFGDIDGDGDDDLYVTTLGEFRNYLFVNEGGVFIEDGVARGAAVVSAYQHAGSTAAFADYDNDGDLDLYTGEWMTHALGMRPSHARLLRNLGPEAPGTFEDVTADAGLVLDDVYLAADSPIAGTFVLSVAWSDVDGDSFPDLLLPSDFRASRLFWNNGDGSFLDGTTAAGVGTDENGMGGTLGDYDGDGDLDWFVTSIESDVKTGNRLYRYEGDRMFVDRTDDAGVRDASWGWGTSLVDMDLDGDLDLVATNGWYGTDALVDPMVAWVSDGDGHFVESAAALGLDDTGQGRGLVTFDADGDGDAEVLVVGVGGSVKLYRNDGDHDGRHWLRVRAPGTASNTNGIGAVIEVIGADGGWRQEIHGGSHYLGHGPREGHFGVSDETVVEVRVRWPASGREVVLDHVVTDQVIVVPEPDA